MNINKYILHHHYINRISSSRLVLFIGIILTQLSITGFSQNSLALPSVNNFSSQVIKGGLQTWDIKQDHNGLVYFANNEGLIVFDGKYWKNYHLPNKSIVRSIEITKENKIFIGGQDELGFFESDKNGGLKYRSLNIFLPKEDKFFGDVWDIINFNDCIFFRTDSKIFKFCNNKFEVFTSRSRWLFLGIADNKIFAQEEKNGLLFFENNLWHQTNWLNQELSPITSIFYLQNNKLVITTLKNGIFFKKQTETIFTAINPTNWNKDQIYAAQKINDSCFAIATTNNGLLVGDNQGNIIQKISKKEGLQNNNILSLLYDSFGNLWLGLNNGIDMVAYNNAIKIINPNFEDAAGYAALIKDNQLYLGTSNNLYTVNVGSNLNFYSPKNALMPVTQAKGQCWGLTTINNQVLLGHHDGGFVVEHNEAKKITSQNGFWNYIATDAVFPSNFIVGGNYYGLTLFSYFNNCIKEQCRINGFNESSRYITIDGKQNLWVSHPYHGIFKISNYLKTNIAKVETFGSNHGLPSDLNNHVFKIKNEIVAATNQGVYLFNTETNKFESHNLYNKLIGHASLKYLKEDTEGNIWFVASKNLGVIDFSFKNNPKIIYITELEGKILSGFENVYPINKNHLIVGGEKGFFLIDFEKYKSQLQKPTIQISQVKVTGEIDSTLFSGFGAPDVNPIKIKYGWSSLHFEFSSTSAYNNPNLLYSYRLQGFEKNWSEWTTNTEKEYTNLNAGNYVFEVKVKNNLGIESSVVSYTFSVLPAWYKSGWMKFAYIILGIGLLVFVYKKQQKKFSEQQKKHEEDQQKLKYIHDLEINKTEAELIALQNEKLAQEIEFKNAELASSAMHLVQKSEILNTVKTSLLQLTKDYGSNVHATNEIKKLLKNLGNDENIDKEWSSFSKHFDNVHKDFLIVLKEKHPLLTPTDLKLSAFLYMNFSTKEIAQLMNISVRGVEISRYRLRKKLELKTEISLVDYMISIVKK